MLYVRTFRMPAEPTALAAGPVFHVIFRSIDPTLARTPHGSRKDSREASFYDGAAR